MASEESSESVPEITTSPPKEDVLVEQSTMFDNVNYMGRAVIGKLN